MKHNRLIIDALIFEKNKAFGYQQFLFNLLDYFYENIELFNYSKVIILCKTNEIDSFSKYDSKMSIVCYKYKNKLGHLFQQTLFPIRLKLKKDDVVLYTYNYTSLIKKSKTALVIHDLLFKRKNLLPNKLMRYQREFFLPISVKLADTIMSISEFTKSDIEKYYPKAIGKVNAVYIYFNFKKFSNSKKIDIPNKPYFLSVCSTAIHKNIISLLKAFNLFCNQDDNYNLVLLGGLSDKNSNAYHYYSNLSEEVKNRIILLENISNDELSYVYDNAKLFISLSLFEGLGMPIVEAMYFNLPVLLSDIKVHREVSMSKGVYCDPFDFEKISDILLHFDQMFSSLNLREGILDQYSQENTGKKVISILNNL